MASLVIEVAAAMGWWCGEKESEMREEDGEKRSIVVMVQQWRCVVAVERGDENSEVGTWIRVKCFVCAGPWTNSPNVPKQKKYFYNFFL